MSIWRALVMLLTLRCDDSTRLMSEECERTLTPVERWAVRLHFLSCRYCHRFRKQLRLIQRAAKERGETPATMPAEIRERLLRSLDQQTGFDEGK